MNEPVRIGAAFVTPPNGNPLHQATVSVEQQFTQHQDFRRSLIKGLNQTKEWERLARTGDALGEDSNQLILDIYGDRVNNKTYLDIYKNGRNVSIEIGSTWEYNEEVFLYFGSDGAIGIESFQLSGITKESHCDIHITTETNINEICNGSFDQ